MGAAGGSSERRRVDAGDQHAQRRAVGVFLAGGQIDRLRLRLAVVRRAVRQEAVVGVGPQPLVQRLDALLRRRLDDGAQAVRQRVPENLRQRLIDAAALEMIEAEFGHRRVEPTPRRRR